MESAPTRPFPGILTLKACAIQVTHAETGKSFMAAVGTEQDAVGFDHQYLPASGGSLDLGD